MHHRWLPERTVEHQRGGYLVHDGGEYDHADELLLHVFWRRPFSGGGKDCLKERYVHAFTYKGSAVPKEPRSSLPLAVAEATTTQT